MSTCEAKLTHHVVPRRLHAGSRDKRMRSAVIQSQRAIRKTL